MGRAVAEVTGQTYAAFLAAREQANSAHGFEPTWLPDWLFGFQTHLTSWAVRQGRAGLFADCGMGKTPMALVWAENVRRHTGRPVLLLTPLAVSAQIAQEAAKFGIDAAVSRDGTRPAGITITNYERLSRFDPADYGGVVCDESSAIKSFDGQLRAQVTEFCRTLPYRLLDTATAAPNDYVELGTTSEALGYLGYTDMLSRWFTNREKTIASVGGRWRAGAGEMWRFKGHAETPFWRWVASWGRAVRRPSDLGFADDGFVLPPLRIRQHIVDARSTREDVLFDLPAIGLREEREESRRTIPERCEKAAELLTGQASGVAWCQLNAEGDLLTDLIDGAVQVSGADTPEEKEEKLLAFSAGQIRVLVTKPVIGAWGLNWQHCNLMTYFPSHSFEQRYQAIRRSWRFGQENPVDVHDITTSAGTRVLANLQRKADQADRMFDNLVHHMRDAAGIQRPEPYDLPTEVPAWATS
jgi:hypothetical protein